MSLDQKPMTETLDHGPQDSHEESLLTRLLREHGVGEEAARAVEHLGAELRVHARERDAEFAAMVDAETGAQVGEILSGGRSEVRIGPHLDAVVAGRQYVHLHTHPGSSSFSSTDATVFAQTTGLQVMAVVGADGTWYVLSRRAGAAPLHVQTLAVAYRSAIAALASRFQSLVRSGAMTPQAAWREHSHQAWQQVAGRLALHYDRGEPR